MFSATRDGVSQLYRRLMDQLDASPIPGTKSAQSPFFSPDGEWVGFFAEGKLKKVSLAGSLPVSLCDSHAHFGASWGPDDTITFASSEYPGLMQVQTAGGELEVLKGWLSSAIRSRKKI